MDSKGIKAVLFDCDGTLVDSEYAHYLGFKEIMHEMGEELTLDEYDLYAGQSDARVAYLLAHRLGKACADEILAKKMAYNETLGAMGLPSIGPTIDFVKRLAARKNELGIKIGLCSAACHQELRAHLHHLGIEACFDLILSGVEDLDHYADPEGVNKPKPYIYLHAAKLLGVQPSECVVIEDSHPGVTAAVVAGCIAVAIPNHYTRGHDLSQADIHLTTFQGLELDQFFQMVAQR